MRTVPRERFCPEDVARFAYDDTPLPIGEGQTISQPYIVAAMAAAARLRPDSRVLEIGTGSGYGAAVLSEVAGEVWTIERIAPLADRARRCLADLGYANVHVICGDGTLGLPEQAPFDAIVVTAGGPSVPDALVEQLADGGVARHPRRSRDPGPATRASACDAETSSSRRTWGRSGSCRSWATRVGPRPETTVADARLASRRITGGLPSYARSPSRSRRFTTPSSDRSWNGSVIVPSFSSVRPRTGRRSSTACANASPASSSSTRASPRSQWRRTGPTRPGSMPCPSPAADRSLLRGVLAVPDLDVAQPRGAGVRRLAPRPQRHRRGPGTSGELPRTRPVQPVHVPRRRARATSTASTPEAAAVARAPLRLPDPVGARPGGLRSGRRHRPVRGLRGRRGRRRSPTCCSRRLDYAAAGGDDFVDAAQNAVVVANAERYYRIMYYGSRESWNLRDLHMFETLQTRPLLPRPRHQGRRVGAQLPRR